MVNPESVQYRCSKCKSLYDFKHDAEECCKKKEIDYGIIDSFEIKPEHLKLLKEMNVGWDTCEFGAPCIDPKRPYGNSNGVDDVARVIELIKTKKNVEFDAAEAKEYESLGDYLEEAEWSEETYQYLRDLHKQTEVVLQICLSTLSFQVGKYKKRDKYGSEWVRI